MKMTNTTSFSVVAAPSPAPSTYTPSISSTTRLLSTLPRTSTTAVRGGGSAASGGRTPTDSEIYEIDDRVTSSPTPTSASPSQHRKKQKKKVVMSDGTISEPTKPKTLLGRAKAGVISVSDGLVDRVIGAITFLKNAKLNTRSGLRQFVNLDQFHVTIITLVSFDIMFVFADLIVVLLQSCLPVDSKNNYDPINGTCTPILGTSTTVTNARQAFFWISIILMFIFCSEIALTMYALGFSFFKSFIRVIDALVVYSSLGWELYIYFTGQAENGSEAVVILRLWKLVRAMHAIAHSMELRNKSVRKSVKESNHTIINECVRMLKDLKVETDSLQNLITTVEHAGIKVMDRPKVAHAIGDIYNAMDQTLSSQSAVEDLGLALSLVMIQLCL